MPRTVSLVVMLAGVAASVPAAAQDCFPYDSTTRFAGELPLASLPVCMVADGPLTYVVTATQLICVDTTDPVAPVVVGQVSHGVTPRCCELMDDFVVIGTSNGLRVFDVSDPAAPVALGSATAPQPVEDFAVCDDLLIAAVGTAGLRFYEVSAAGVVQAAGSFPSDWPAHGVAPLGPHRALVATEEVLLDLDVADPQSPVVLQELRPATLPENWPFYLGVDVAGNLAVVAMQEGLPVARAGGERDWNDATTLMLLDFAAMDPDTFVRGHWTADWQSDVVLDDIAADRVVAHDRTTLLVLSLAAPPVRPSAWQPLVAIETEAAVAGAALTGGGIAVGLASSWLRMLPTDDPLVVPTLTRFAPGEYVQLVDDDWAYSYTPHGNYQDTAYLYSLWDLRAPLAPHVVQTVSCQAGFDFGHSCAVEAAGDDLILRVDRDSNGSVWRLQDWSAGAGTSVTLATTRQAAVFAGDLLLTLGYDVADYGAPAGLEVVDVSDPAAPVVRGFLPQSGLVWGANLVLGERWLTVLHGQSTNRLLVVDLSDPDQPEATDLLDVPDEPRFLALFGDLVLGADAGGDLWVYGLDPLRVVGHLAGQPPVIDLAVAGETAWVLWKVEGLVAVDLSDPAAPAQRGVCAVPSVPRALAVRGGVAYVAGDMAGVHAYDVSDPDAPAWLGGGGAPATALRDRGACLVVPGAVLPLDCSSLVATPEAVPLPATAAVRARPNPFNPRTVVGFDLPRPGHAELTVYDLRGRCVRELWRGEQAAGRHDVVWDGADAAGRAQPSGVYLVRLRTRDTTATRTITLAR